MRPDGRWCPGRWPPPPSVIICARCREQQTRTVLEMLSVLNIRTPIVQLGQAAQTGAPSEAIEPAGGLAVVER